MPAPLIKEDELQMIKSAIILPYVLTVFERDKEIIGKTLKTPSPYIEKIDLAMDQITKDIAANRNSLRQHGIRINDGKRGTGDISHAYLYRGYKGDMTLLMDLVSAEVSILMAYYLGNFDTWDRSVFNSGKG